MPVSRKTRELFNIRTRRGEWVGIIALILVALVAYVWFLNHEERRVEGYFAELRQSDPEQYLNEVKQVSGFEEYLLQYAALKGYDTFRRKAPEFLLGRWSVTTEAKRVSDSYEAVICANPMLIENGRVTYPGDKKASDNNMFRMNGALLTIRRPDGQTNTLHLVSSGVFLHHIELKLPGSSTQRYAYSCK